MSSFPRHRAQIRPMLEPLSQDELEFIRAIEDYKAEHAKAHLSWTEVLGVIRRLGYRKVRQGAEKESESIPQADLALER